MTDSNNQPSQASKDLPGNGDSAESARTPFRQCAPDHFRTRLHVSYDGTDFCGWQRQVDKVTVQGTLEAALTKVFGKPITLMGASRTDSGVHANQQVAHFDAPRDPSAFDLRYSIQCLTPESIVVKEIFQAPPDFHAIASVQDKVYRYRVLNRRVPSAFRHRYSLWIRHPLDLEFLNAASEFILGKQDFKSFQSMGTVVQSTVRHITRARWQRLDEDTLEFTIQGDGFLKQMVRNIVGTLIDLNLRNSPPERVREMLDALDRRKAGPTAEPQGLFLDQVNYPESVDNKCRKL
jgi:tRNA pseudouridine38-40 synthase